MPNLETRFIAADTLIGLDKPNQTRLRNLQIDQKERQLNSIRSRYFSARTLKHKRDFKEADKKIRHEIAELLINDGWQDHNAHRIADWDLYDQNTAVNWFDPEWMFGVTNGFDLVIGNPPYIQLQNEGGKLGNYYKNGGYSTFSKSGDIYQLFYERGCQLLKAQHGFLSFITSNSWLKAKYGGKLRRYFYQHQSPMKLLEVGKDVFENAIVDVSILILRSGKSNELGKAVDMDRLQSSKFPPECKYWSVLRPQDDKPWMTLSAIEQRILDKIETVGTPLKEWDISIYRGVLTGYNEAFIVDNHTKDALIASDPNSAEILKPILRGRDVQRFRAQWAGMWVIDTHNGYEDVPPINVDDFPAVKAHLNQYYPQLRKRYDKGRTPYNLRHCAYHAEFERDKLVWMQLSPEGRFAYDEDRIFCNQKAFIVTGTNLKYLCAVLNSKVVTWLMVNTAVTTGMGLIQWDKFTVETIPIPYISEIEQIPLVALIDEITDFKKHNKNTISLENQLDEIVYQLYGLSADQTRAIRNG